MKTTKEQLLFMMQRYEIGKKPLSRLLGWGDTTVLRYLDGVEPNREFAGRIGELAENPWLYAEVLEKNKEKLTDTAYRKTRRAVYREIFCDRSTEAMQYVVELAEGDIAPYRVMTVLYYAQVCSMVLRGFPLFEEEADFSPGQQLVYPRLYGQMMRFGLKLIKPETGSLSLEEQEYLNPLENDTYKVIYEKHGWEKTKEIFEGLSKLESGGYMLYFEMRKSKIGNMAFLNVIMGCVLDQNEGVSLKLNCNVTESNDDLNHFWLLKEK